MTWRSFILGSLTAVLIAAPATAQSPVIGVASVVDGDTLEIHGQRIRLHAVDAPESKPVFPIWMRSLPIPKLG